jgi:hypothetical protein
VTIQVELTATAARQVRDLRGRRRKGALAALVELRGQGCSAAGYRLTGARLDHVCARHLYGEDRMLIAWPGVDHAVVVAVGRHDRSSEDVYTVLLDALGLEMPESEREKPPCCDEAGRPPAHPGVAADIADAAERLGRTR